MKVETINREGKLFVLLPLSDFQKIAEDAEMLADIKAYDRIKARIMSGEEEVIPASLIMRRLAGESPLKIWREYRDMTQEVLSAVSGVSRSMIAAIESGHKKGSITTLKSLAVTLNCDVDSLS